MQWKFWKNNESRCVCVGLGSVALLKHGKMYFDFSARKSSNYADISAISWATQSIFPLLSWVLHCRPLCPTSPVRWMQAVQILCYITTFPLFFFAATKSWVGLSSISMPWLVNCYQGQARRNAFWSGGEGFHEGRQPPSSMEDFLHLKRCFLEHSNYKISV